MKQEIAIYCKTSGRTLYEGRFRSFRECAERAVEDKTDLKGADFRHRNLSGATMDDALMDGADFTGANLAGANLSESNLRSCLFLNANLVDACLSYGVLNGSDFRGARFGATDIAGAQLRLCTFSGLSTFSLDLTSAGTLQDSLYIHQNGNTPETTRTITMQSPPMVLYGALHTPVIIFDQEIVIGAQCLPLPPHHVSLRLIPWLATLFQEERYKILT